MTGVQTCALPILEETARQEELIFNTYAIEIERVKAESSGIATEFSQYETVELNLKQ